jgi:hypothetical protein
MEVQHLFYPRKLKGFVRLDGSQQADEQSKDAPQAKTEKIEDVRGLCSSLNLKTGKSAMAYGIPSAIALLPVLRFWLLHRPEDGSLMQPKHVA